MRELRAALRAPGNAGGGRPARLRIRSKRAAGLDCTPTAAQGGPGSQAAVGAVPAPGEAFRPAAAVRD
eukprot:8839510-Alexandrium_andersonii.AAC.1